MSKSRGRRPGKGHPRASRRRIPTRSSDLSQLAPILPLMQTTDAGEAGGDALGARAVTWQHLGTGDEFETLNLGA